VTDRGTTESKEQTVHQAQEVATDAVVGVVGLGAMGGPIAGHLLGAGIEVVVADLDAELVRTYVEAGASAAAGLHDLGARCDVVLVVVTTDEDVLAVCGGEAGLLSGCRPGTSVLLCSSVRPDTCAAVTGAAPDDVSVLDAALTGGVRGAEDGTINLLVGGDPEVLRTLAPVLEPWTSSVHHLGPLGAGQVGKTVNNLVHWAQISAITEALELGRRYGLDVPTLRRALMDGPTASRTLRDMEHMRFTWHAKDLANADVMAAAVELPLPVAQVAREVMKQVTVARVHELLTATADPHHGPVTFP
jgi:3-hydroxyisobutyrate dehydrogenase-like beta-hydroxyacid dehydrogenase